MTVQVKSWGNSQGIRLSREMLETAGIHVNEYLDVTVEDGKIVLSKTFRHKTLEERAAAYQNQMGPYEEFEWGQPVGREQW